MAQQKKTSPLVFIVVAVMLLLLGAVLYAQTKKVTSPQPTASPINSFDDCVKAGNPILETFPEQCRTADGKTFTKENSDSLITVTGKMVCLPHKNQGEIQTMECAFGLQAEDGTYYSLQSTDPSKPIIFDNPTGKKVQVSGMFTPRNDSIYKSAGVIEVQSMTQL